MVHRTFSGVLIGDELGLIKKLDLRAESNSSQAIRTLNRDFIGDPSPGKSVLSIHPLTSVSMLDSDEDENSDDSDDDSGDDDDGFDADRERKIGSKSKPSTKSTASKRLNTFEESKFIYLIGSRPNHVYLYNSYNEQFTSISSSSSSNNGSGKSGNLIGAVPIDGNSYVSCYDNGKINIQSIKSDILTVSSQCNSKALKFFGVEKDDYTSSPASPAKRRKKHHQHDSKANQPDSVQKGKKSSHLHSESSSTLFSPNWQPSNTCVTCFDVSNNRIAIGGKNVDLRVFDLTTKQCIFQGKSQTKDYLGLRSKIWLSDLTWLGPSTGKMAITSKSTISSAPSMIATCSRTEPVVRIYDLKSKQRKPIWLLNFKDQTFNNDSNPPAFTKMCATGTPGIASTPAQQLILGTTMGRMMAVDLRYNSHSHRHLGVFKSYGGGAIRDIKFVSLGSSKGKVISCSLDRFVRVHSFSMGANKTRALDCKQYMKTKPTCIQPIIVENSFTESSISQEDSVNLQDDEEFDELL